jgi:soluble lytic murein transglycosylase-like protein
MITAPIPNAGTEVARSMQSDRSALADFVTEASQRFGIPQAWIYGVIDVESRGVPNARSPRGALGLMQLMPATWRKLRLQLALGTDPLDPHDNIIAGTAYLRILFDQYGAGGFLAAYNAGPGRYENALSTGKPLPEETVSYVAQLAHRLQLDSRERIPVQPATRSIRWPKSPLFAGSTITSADGPDTAETQAKRSVFAPLSLPNESPPAPPPSP